MTTELVLHTPDQAFGLAERIAKSALVPSAYRGKPTDLAIALMFGAEIGLPPMAAMNRIVVVEGKPALDAQGMVAVIRAAGHSLSGETSSDRATVKGKRGDTGDEMTVTFSMDDARRANLTNKGVWKSYPSSMLWARAVSQLARMLFADCLLGFSYVPEEADFDGKHEFTADGALVAAPAEPASAPEGPAEEPKASRRSRAGTVRQPPTARAAAAPPQEPEDAVVLVDPDQCAELVRLFDQLEDQTARAQLKQEFLHQWGKPAELPQTNYADAYGWLLHRLGEIEPITDTSPAVDGDDEQRPF